MKNLIKILIIFLNISYCTQSKNNQSPLESDIILLGNIFVESSLASTANRCALDYNSNSSYFSSGTIPSGYTNTVNREYTTLSDGNKSEIYYPTGTSTGLPILIMFPGGNVHGSYYSKLAAGLASSGYVVYVPYRCTIFFFQYFLAPDINLPSYVLTDAKTQNSSNANLLSRIDTASIGLLGHSLGGVIGLFKMNDICDFPFCTSSTATVSEIKAGYFYGSGLGTSYSSSRYKTTNGSGIPTMYVQGSLDSAFTPTEASNNFKNVISPSYLYTLDGANHYGVTDIYSPLLANAEKNSATLSQESGIQSISKLGVLFMDAYLKSNSTSLSNIQSGSTGVSNMTLTSSK